jgi:hypothetical protein
MSIPYGYPADATQAAARRHATRSPARPPQEHAEAQAAAAAVVRKLRRHAISIHGGEHTHSMLESGATGLLLRRAPVTLQAHVSG